MDGYGTSPVVHADEYDWLSNSDGPSDNTAAVISGEPNIKTGLKQRNADRRCGCTDFVAATINPLYVYLGEQL